MTRPDLNIDHLLPQQTLFETETFFGIKIRELMAARSMLFSDLVLQTEDYLEECKIPASEERKSMAMRIAGELYYVGTVGMSMKMFALGLKIIGFKKLNVELHLNEKPGWVPTAIMGEIGLGGE
jgi:hypothetical protein